MHKIDLKKVALYVVLAYALSWSVVLAYFGLGGRMDSVGFMLASTVSMWGPALAAIIVQKGIRKKPLAELGLRWHANRWLVVAWLLPLAIVGLAVGMSAGMPGASLSSGTAYIREAIAALPADQAAEARRQLEQSGMPSLLLLVGATVGGTLVAGPTVNAAVALGEELGWRGLLQRELAPLGFWTASGIVGVVWGLWHAPLVLNGYNYPEHPVLGVGMMTVMTLLLSPLFAHVAERGRTVLAPAVLHGGINAAAGAGMLFVAGGSRLTTGLTGAAGLAALALCNGLLYVWRRREARRASLNEAASAP